MDGLEYVAGVHVVVVGVAVARVARLDVHQHRLHRQRGNLQQEEQDGTANNGPALSPIMRCFAAGKNTILAFFFVVFYTDSNNQGWVWLK